MKERLGSLKEKWVLKQTTENTDQDSTAGSML